MSSNQSPHALTAEMKGQLNRFFKAQEQKHLQKFTSENQFLTQQLQKAKALLEANDKRISQQKQEIDNLNERIRIIETRTQSRLIVLSKELHSFKDYYSQCYEYTLSRVNEVDEKICLLAGEIKDVAKSETLQIVQYVRYVNQMLTNIIKNNQMKTIDLQFVVNEELFQLEKRIGNFTELFEQLNQQIDHMKSLHYSSTSFKETIEQSIRGLQNKLQIFNDQGLQMKKKIIQSFESKYKEIIKKVNTSSMQLQMIENLLKNQNSEHIQKSSLKENQIKILEEKIEELQKIMEQEKLSSQKIINKKQDLLRKRQQRILQLEESLEILLNKQIQLQKQISQLKMKNLSLIHENQHLTKELQRQKTRKNDNVSVQNSEKDSVQNQNGSETVSFFKNLDEQNDQVEQCKKSEQLKQKSLLDTKLSKSKRILSPDMKEYGLSETRVSRSKSKEIIRNKSPRISNFDVKSTLKIENSRKQIEKVLQQKDKLQKLNTQLLRTNKQLQKEICSLIAQRSKQNEEDTKYMDEIQSQIQRNQIEIESLRVQNLNLRRQILQIKKSCEVMEQQFELQKSQSQNRQYKLQKIINQLNKRKSDLQKQNQKLSYEILALQESLNGDMKRSFMISNGRSNKINDFNYESDIDSRSTSHNGKSNKRALQPFILELQKAIAYMGLPTPIMCSIDKNGFIKQMNTNTYLVNSKKNPIRLNEEEITLAIENGLILL